jgi:hypothetical protein
MRKGALGILCENARAVLTPRVAVVQIRHWRSRAYIMRTPSDSEISFCKELSGWSGQAGRVQVRVAAGGEVGLVCIRLVRSCVG